MSELLLKQSAVVSGILFGLGFGFYWHALRKERGETMPVTWLILSVMNTFILVSMLHSGAFNWQIGVATVGSWAVYIAASRHGSHRWSGADWLWLGLAVIGWIAWVLTDEPLYALIISTVVSFFGAFPMFGATYRDPSGEPKHVWLLFWSSCVFNLFAVPEWHIAHWLQPVIFFVVDSTMLYLLLFTRGRG